MLSWEKSISTKKKSTLLQATEIKPVRYVEFGGSGDLRKPGGVRMSTIRLAGGHFQSSFFFFFGLFLGEHRWPLHSLALPWRKTKASQKQKRWGGIHIAHQTSNPATRLNRSLGMTLVQLQGRSRDKENLHTTEYSMVKMAMRSSGSLGCPTQPGHSDPLILPIIYAW